ncbi:hypothetical protein ACJX0J_010352, partial [Zea mays]
MELSDVIIWGYFWVLLVSVLSAHFSESGVNLHPGTSLQLHNHQFGTAIFLIIVKVEASSMGFLL